MKRPRTRSIVILIALLTAVTLSPLPGRRGLTAKAGALPQISSVQILHLGQAVDSFEADKRGGEYRILITGKGFDSSSKVFFSGKKIRTSVLSDTEISAKPAGVDLMPGEVSLQVINRDGTGSSNSVIVDVISNPSVLSVFSITPNVSPAGAQAGSQVTISGLGFTATGNHVRFIKAANPALRGLTADVDSSDGSTLVFNVPADVCIACAGGLPCPDQCFSIDPGQYQIAVTNSNGLSNSRDLLVSSPTGPIGIWADDIATLVSDVQVDVEGACWGAIAPGTLTTDAQGNFDLMGRYLVFAGPIRPGDPGIPAELKGSINGNTMTLTIIVGGDWTLGPYTLSFGVYKTIIHPCL